MEKTIQIINDKGNVQVIFQGTVMSFGNCTFDPYLCTDVAKTYRIISTETKKPICFFTTSLDTTELIN